MDNSSNDIIVIEKDKLQRYLDLVGVVIVVVDRHGNVCVVNKRGCDVTGYNKDEIIGRNCFDNFFVDSSRQPSRAIFNQVISGEIEPIEFYETQILTKSGQERTILWHNDVIRDGGGAITYIISSGEDITDMLIRENALRESEEKFKALFEQAMDPLFLVDAKDGRILMFNESAHKLYGYSREEFELIKISDVEIVESPEEIMKHIKKIEKYGADSFETMHKTKDGRILHVHAGINNVRIGGKSHNIAIFRDITNMKHVESELIMRTKQLEEINKQLERRVQEQIDRMLAKERIIMQQAKIAADEAVLQAADILEKNGQVDRSIEQILKIKKWKRFEELINTHAQHIIDDGRHDTVDRWFSQVPYEIMRDYPWLMFWQGVNRQYINPPDARMILETAYALFKPIDKAGQLWALTAIVKTYLLQWTDFNPLDYWISEFEGQLIEVYQKSGNETLREAAISSIAPALMFRQPTHKDIDYWIAEAENIALNSKRFENRLITGYNLSIYYLWSGQVYKAGVIVERLSLPIRQSTGHPMLRLVCLGVEATYWVWRAEYAKAVKTADEGLEIARLTGIHLLDIVLLTASVFASLAIGDDTAAGGYQKRILSYMEGLQTYPATYHQTASLIEAANGALPFAVEHAEKWLSLAVHSGCPQMPAVHRFVLAYVLTEAGRHEEAMRHINEMEEIGAAVKSRLFENWGFAIKSLIALKTGGMTKFDAMFDNYVRLAKITGLKYILPLHKPVALICKTAIERNIQTDFVKDLITSHNIKADGHTIEHWPWAVKIYTLGRFEILRNGSPMQFSAKPQKTPLMMLKAIIAAGGRHVDTTLLADQLWPDEDGDAAHNLFGTNIHRLRKLLGGKEFINYTDGDLCLNPELCWVDIWAFDDIVNRINNTFHSGDEQSVISLFEQMCSLYKGEFIPGLQNESWAIHTRARLSSSLVESCTQTGTWLENRNKWEEAAHCYKRTIAIHDSDEHLYQRLMQCYHALGRNADVISTYKQCKAALLSKFGVEPSPATVAICESVNNSSQ